MSPDGANVYSANAERDGDASLHAMDPAASGSFSRSPAVGQHPGQARGLHRRFTGGGMLESVIGSSQGHSLYAAGGKRLSRH